MTRTAVVALGGNAFTQAGQAGSHREQYDNAVAMANTVANVRAAGWNVVLVHGNGPQVGNLAIQQEEGLGLVPGQPLFALDAMTQGQLGSLISLAMHAVDPKAAVVALVTHAVVSREDPAFADPTKPIGPFFTRERADELTAERGWVVAEDAGRGFRRVVASPRPVDVVESAAIATLVASGTIVIAGGGGGVPVVDDGGALVGVEAVIDKDYMAAHLATELGAEALVLVTGVPRVMLDFGRPTARAIDQVDVDEAERYQAEGQFPEGSMGPKIRAATQFLRTGGSIAVITSPDLVAASLLQTEGSGTRIVAAPATPSPCAPGTVTVTA